MPASPRNQTVRCHPDLKGGICFGSRACLAGTQKSSSLRCPNLLIGIIVTLLSVPRGVLLINLRNMKTERGFISSPTLTFSAYKSYNLKDLEYTLKNRKFKNFYTPPRKSAPMTRPCSEAAYLAMAASDMRLTSFVVYSARLSI